jgi:receptor protein-tyrosine kinase
MSDQPESTGPAADYSRLLARSWLLMIVTALAAATAAFLASSAQPSKYRASSKILVSTSADNSTFAGNEDPARVIATLVKLAKSGEIVSYAAKRAHVATATLDDSTRVSGSLTADVVTVTGTARNPAAAAYFANALAGGFVDWQATRTREQTQARVTFLQRQLGKLAGQTSPSAVAAASDIRTQLSEALAELQVPNSDVVIISPATAPLGRFSPQPLRNAVLALIAGALIALGIALLRERLDTRIRSDDELESIYAAPILGHVPYVTGARSGDRSAALADLAKETPLADAFRTIRTNVSLFRRIQGKTQVVLVTSAMPGEGKTTVTANLARAFAVAGQRVLAISADVHSPTLHLVLLPEPSNDPSVGIVEVLADRLPLDGSARRHHVAGPGGMPSHVAVLANGRRFPDPSILFQSRVMEDVLAKARELYDIVLIDAPPMLAKAEAALLASRADGMILVTRNSFVTRQQAHEVSRMLQASAIKPLGLVVVVGRGESAGRYDAYGYYGHRHEKDEEEAQLRPLERKPAARHPAPAQRASSSER